MGIPSTGYPLLDVVVFLLVLAMLIWAAIAIARIIVGILK